MDATRGEGATGADREQAGAPADSRDWTPYAIYTLGFLTLVSSFNYLDRSVLGLALPAIKTEMAISDTALGLISGLAFVVFYATLGVPIAWLADRWNRRNIIAIGFFFWSLMTFVTGFVGNIWQLTIARFLMGAGEAAGLPPSNSILSDVFRKARRPLALAIFGTASSISSVAFYPLLGWVGDVYGWRAMFIASGVPGMILAVIFFLTVKEPTRGAVEEAGVAKPKPLPFMTTVRHLAGSRTYVLLLVAVTFMGANLFAAAAWAPTFLVRVHGLTLTEVAASLGPIRGILGGLGILLGGFVIDRLGRRDERWRLRLPAIACLLVAPAEVAFLLGEVTPVWMAGYAATTFFTLIHQPAVYAATMNVATPAMRATATAILLLFASLVSQALGPALVGFLNDYLTPRFGDLAIRYSLLMVVVTALISAVALWAAASSMERDIRRAAEL